MNTKTGSTQPAFYISHGGGPCFWMDWGPTRPFDQLASFLRNFQNLLPQKPTAILVISAHWEEENFTIQTNPQPGMLYDYYGFPEDTYQLQYPAKTSKWLIEKTKGLFKKNHVTLNEDSQRGYDHGVFVPFMLMFPDADIPVVQLSMKENLNPKEHLQLGKMLEPLRHENVLIVGSGLSYHNLRHLNDIHGFSKGFDDWLNSTALESSEKRNQNLIHWEKAPHARFAHPREDHLLPLMVIAGAAENEKASRVYNEQMSNWKFWTSSFKFG